MPVQYQAITRIHVDLNVNSTIIIVKHFSENCIQIRKFAFQKIISVNQSKFHLK